MFLCKTPAILATAFFLICWVFAYMAALREGPATVIDEIEQGQVIEMVAPEPAVDESNSGFDETVPLPADAPAESDVPPPVGETE